MDILGKHVLSNKVISAGFNDMDMEDGIRELILIAGIENYALACRKDSGSQFSASQILFLSGGVEQSEDSHLAKETQRADFERKVKRGAETRTASKTEKLTTPPINPKTQFISSSPTTDLRTTHLGIEIG